MMSILQQKLTQKQQDLPSTEKDIYFHEEYNWYISPSVISERIIDSDIAGSETFYRGKKDNILKVNSGYIN